MKVAKVILWIVLLGFLGLAAQVTVEHGYLGFFELMLANSATRLGFIDLSISLTLITVWMWIDAKQHGRAIAPYIAITLLLGCPGPLIYLIGRKGG